MDTILISFAIASFFLALAPGPDNFFVLTFSAKYGRTLGILTVLGLVGGCFIHTSLVAFGVSALILNNSILLLLIAAAMSTRVSGEFSFPSSGTIAFQFL